MFLIFYQKYKVLVEDISDRFFLVFYIKNLRTF